MKAIIIDTVLNELKRMNEVENFVRTWLFGLKSEASIIITSAEQKKGLERVGIFCREKEAEVEEEETADSLIKAKEPFEFYLSKGKLNCRCLSGDSKEMDLTVEVINYATDFENRRKGIVDDSQLQGRTATVVGLGSGGAAIVLQLIRSGVKKIIAIEFDTISVSNIGRSVYDLTDVGRKKTDVICGKALRINPYVEIEVYCEDILDMSHETLLSIIEKSDVIIDGTDNVKTKRLINGAAHSTRPVLYPGVYPYGKGGDILFTMPGEPCFECVFGAILKEAGKEKKREWDYLTGQPKPIPALIADIQVVVARTVKLALGILTGDSDDSFIENITEPGCSLLLIGNERGVSVFEDTAFGEVWVETGINPDCICQTLR